jgi:hypothetical protein
MQARNSESDERTRRGATRALLLTGALVALVALPATALAGKGSGSTSTPWIALASVSGESLAAAAQPRIGDSVRFASGYPTTTKNPWVSVTCWFNGSMFYGEGGSPSHEFLLGGETDPAYAGSTASCTAELGDLYWRGGKQYYTYLAKTTFDAAL